MSSNTLLFLKCAPKIAAQWTVIKSTLNEEEYENVLYGTIETWLVWNLTKEQTHATDITCACVTGLYDFYHVSFYLYSKQKVI